MGWEVFPLFLLFWPLAARFCFKTTGNSRWALVILVGLKIAVDLRGHIAERRIMAGAKADRNS